MIDIFEDRREEKMENVKNAANKNTLPPSNDTHWPYSAVKEDTAALKSLFRIIFYKTVCNVYIQRLSLKRTVCWFVRLLCGHISPHFYICMCIWNFLLSIFLYHNLSLTLHISISLSLSLLLSLYIYIHIYECIYIYIYINSKQFKSSLFRFIP